VSSVAVARARVDVANRADGGTVYWVAKLYGFAALVTVIAVGLVGVVLYGYFSERTDEVGPGTRHHDVIAARCERLRGTDRGSR
jgi:hypothetical protein